MNPLVELTGRWSPRNPSSGVPAALQGQALEIEPLAVASIAAPDDLVDKAAIGLQVAEVARSAQQQRVLDRLFEMAVRALDRTVLVRHASIVAGWLHAVMRAQRLVATRLILPRVVIEIAKGGQKWRLAAAPERS